MTQCEAITKAGTQCTRNGTGKYKDKWYCGQHIGKAMEKEKVSPSEAKTKKASPSEAKSKKVSPSEAKSKKVSPSEKAIVPFRKPAPILEWHPQRKSFDTFPSLFDTSEATDLMTNAVATLPWTTVEWSRGRALPRLVCRLDVPPDFLVEVASRISDVVSTAQGKRMKMTGMWCNYYRDGKDWTPEHQDSYGCTVATLSLGGTRDLATRDLASRKLAKIPLKHGGLYFFNEDWNSKNTHAVPKTKVECGPRVSLVFFLQ